MNDNVIIYKFSSKSLLRETKFEQFIVIINHKNLEKWMPFYALEDMNTKKKEQKNTIYTTFFFGEHILHCNIDATYDIVVHNC